MTIDEKQRVNGFLKIAFSCWGMYPDQEAFKDYLGELDDLPFQDVKDSIVHLSKALSTRPTPVSLRNDVMFHMKLKMASLAEQ